MCGVALMLMLMEYKILMMIAQHKLDIRQQI
jgi:hypothetical protein